MKSGTARVFEHQIPGGQYSNLIVQCQSMGLWDQWEAVLDAYRDVNKLFGDIVKVTPSSKCVGDLALYLVTRNVTADDLLDPAKASTIDFPESVVGLLKGDLGFPHRGFPKVVEDAILKGAARRTVRAGLVLQPADFELNVKTLSEKWGVPITPEMGMSSLMYPAVFADYMKRLKSKGPLLPYLPTPAYFYAMQTNQVIKMKVPAQLASHILKEAPTASAAAADEFVDVSIEMKRVGPLKEGKRTVVFSVNGKGEQHVDVKDSTGAFVFDGPMANTAIPGEIPSPMPGVIEKLLVKEGQTVAAGDTLLVVSAMKMEVKSTAPFSGKVTSIAVLPGARVVEGALCLVLSATSK